MAFLQPSVPLIIDGGFIAMTTVFRLRLASLVLILLTLIGCATATRVTLDRYGVELTRGTTQLMVRAYAGDAFEVQVRDRSQKPWPSFARSEDAQLVAVTIEEDANHIRLTNGALLAAIDKTSWQIRYYRKNQLLTEQLAFQAQPRAVAFDFSLAEGEKILGGGQRVLGMDRRGHRLPLYNRAHYGYTTESKQMYYSLPAVMSDKKYWIVYDNAASGFLDIGETEKNTLRFESRGGRAAYWISADNSYPELIENYVTVTGRQPMPARWALGNHASRFGYRSQQQVERVIDEYRQKDFPVDSVILDLFWFGPDIKGHVGNLDWDRTTFPDPEAMIQRLRAKGVKTIVITEPFVLTTSKRWQEAVEKGICAKDANGAPRRFDFYFGNTCLIDVFDQRAMDWFGAIYRDLFHQGIAGTWGDLGEPEVHPDDSIHRLSEYGITARGDEIHNAFGHQWAKLVYQTQRALQPNVRPMIMMRSGFAGTQRYGIIPWTGDVDRSWSGLKPQVELSLQTSLFGLAYTHSDLGGFAGGESFDKELYIRWLQYGVFQPVYRPHAQDHIAPEPIYHDQQTQRITRDYIKLRYRLLPYLYTLAYQHSETGMPLMRPMFFTNEANTAWIDVADQYFWGDAFLVKPITEPNLKSIAVTLPSGVWFDFWSDQAYRGDQTIDYSLTLEKLPVLVKAGAFVPMVDAATTTDNYSSEKLTLHYYADASVKTSKGQMYEDDGATFDAYAKGQFEILKFHSEHDEKGLNLTFERAGGNYNGRPDTRDIQLVIHNWTQAPKSINWGNQPITNWNFNTDKRQLTLSIAWDHSAKRLSIQ
jgi:oligosaccharide 4-alpha-D-glucosyltransferase